MGRTVRYHSRSGSLVAACAAIVIAQGIIILLLYSNSSCSPSVHIHNGTLTDNDYVLIDTILDKQNVQQDGGTQDANEGISIETPRNISLYVVQEPPTQRRFSCQKRALWYPIRSTHEVEVIEPDSKTGKPTTVRGRPLCPDGKSYPGIWNLQQPPCPGQYNSYISPSSFDTVTTQNHEQAQWPVYEPNACQYHIFTKPQVHRCLANRTMIFQGDSLLRTTLTSIIHKYFDATFVWQGFMNNGQDDQIVSLDTQSSQQPFKFHWYWAPSVYAFETKWNAPQQGFGESLSQWIDWLDPMSKNISSVEVPAFDTLVLSMMIWDMGVFNDGLVTYYKSLQNVLQKATRAFRFETTPDDWIDPRLVFFRAPAMHPDRCRVPYGGPCTVCNTPVRQTWFREAQRRALECFSRVQNEMSINPNIDILDTIDLTSNKFAYDNTFDGVHYQHTVLDMLGTRLLNVLCRDFLEDLEEYELKFGYIETELESRSEGAATCNPFDGLDEAGLAASCAFRTPPRIVSTYDPFPM